MTSLARLEPLAARRSTCRIPTLAGCLGVWISIHSSPASAQSIDPSFLATDGQVNAVAWSGSTMYLGGTFSRVGTASGSGVPTNPTTGSPLAAVARVAGGGVYGVVADGAGGWYLGGDFTHVG